MHNKAEIRDSQVHILLVDDEPIVLSSVMLMLQREDRRVYTAQNAEDALCLADEHGSAMDMLISDIRMPGMNGIDLANRLCEKIPRLCVLLMSGYLGDFDLSRAPKHAIILEKPFTFNQLNDLVDRLIERARRGARPGS